MGNGALAEYALAILAQKCQVIFHARTREDLTEVCRLKREQPEAHGVLASYGVIIKKDVLDSFEPEGILNIHPSLLPAYRGPSPIESAILDGRTEFGVSVMKLAPEMDAGPIYWQKTLSGNEIAKAAGVEVAAPELPIYKDAIYKILAETGAKWITQNLNNLPKPAQQDDKKATFTAKLAKSMSFLTPETDTAETTMRKIVAFQGYPKAKYAFCGQNCIILAAHMLKVGEEAALTLKCADEANIAVDRLQPEGRKAMDARSFVNGYGR